MINLISRLWKTLATLQSYCTNALERIFILKPIRTASVQHYTNQQLNILCGQLFIYKHLLNILPVAQRAMKVCTCLRIRSSLSSGSGSFLIMCSIKSLGVTAARFHFNLPRTTSSHSFKRRFEETSKIITDSNLNHLCDRNQLAVPEVFRS